MPGSKRNFLLVVVHISAVLAGPPCLAGEPAPSGMNGPATPSGLEGIWDPAKYISLDEIRPGTKAYCLTEYGVAGIERFELEVIDVVLNMEPGKDAIMVRGLDERFVHTGPVSGCSGSPVYIDGRLAGALAFTWPYAKEPLYGATPIAEMLMVGRGRQADSRRTDAAQAALALDFTAPIDLAEVDSQLRSAMPRTSRGLGGANYLPCPLITTGLPVAVSEQLRAVVEPFGFMVVAGGGSGNIEGDGSLELVPGASLAVPMVSGDITMCVYGTVTEVVDGKVYGFGHSLLGYGRVDLPMAAAKVHTVVSSIASSFKLASVGQTVGALQIDEAAGIVGQIGATAKTIPLTIRVDRFNDTEHRLYNCRLAHNRQLTPLYLRATVAAAALRLGDFPPDHTLEYRVAIGVGQGEQVAFENISTGLGLNEMIIETISSVALLMNNPYERIDIESLDFDIRILPRNIISHIWSAELSDSKVKAGQSVDIAVVVESVLAGRKQYRHNLEIPRDLAPGDYELTVCGSRDYERFLAKAVPYRFVAQSVPQLIDALNSSLQIDRGRLYLLLTLPSGGVTVEKAELPDLPATKALILRDTKRTLRILPYSHWIEQSLETGTVVIDKKTLRIQVEE
ncbi:MAG: hypothetical protein AMJ65_01300 [Phycisphaerae bacterium SG8_4]|nr:MAG: hypothetical protein AMJ65_01300 [Phycisphaerae bacterium SG8_4]